VRWVREFAGEELEEGHAERVDLGADRRRSRPDDALRGHVGHRADHGADAGQALHAREFAQPQVEQGEVRLAVFAVGDEAVERLDVAVQHLRAQPRRREGGADVHRVDRRAQLQHEARHLEPVTAAAQLQRVAVEQRHHEPRAAVEHAVVEHADDVGMINLRRDVGLALEASAVF